jgi:hypothetical protein
MDPINGMLKLAHLMNEDPTKYSGDWNLGPLDSTVSVKNLVEKCLDKFGKGNCIVEQSNLHSEERILKFDINKAMVSLKWRPIWNLNMAVSKTVKCYEEYLENPNMSNITSNQIREYYRDEQMFSSKGSPSREQFETRNEQLNELFISDSIEEIMEFYSNFQNIEQLIQWMRERPRGRAEIYEIEGNEDIIVVIPTADFDGKFAKHCREEVFEGLHMIFVESGRDDPHFNYAHNVNTGLKTALEHKPKWIIVSNDDIYRIDPIKLLVDQLSAIDPVQTTAVSITTSQHHFVPSMLSTQRIVRRLLFNILSFKRSFYFRKLLEMKYQINYHAAARNNLFGRLFFKKGYRFVQFTNFCIFSAEYVRTMNGEILDEVFINGAEDIDLSLRISRNPNKFKHIDFELGDYVGGTLGSSQSRKIRDIANLAYLNFKLNRDYRDLLS